MAFMPLISALIALVCGLTGIVVLPGLEGVGTDQILPRVCALILSGSVLGYWLVVVVFAAALAALMSTADSALLSISSMVTKDLYQAHWRPASTQAELTRVGKVASWLIVAVLVALGLTWGGLPRVAGFHAGVVGLAANLALCALSTAHARWRAG